MIKIYHNPRCRKSREGLKFLQDREKNIEIVDYIKKGISLAEINEIILKLHVRPKDLVRKNEALYKKELKHLEMTDAEWKQVISENPALMQRPVVLAKYKGVIGDPAENIEKVL